MRIQLESGRRFSPHGGMGDAVVFLGAMFGAAIFGASGCAEVEELAPLPRQTGGSSSGFVVTPGTGGAVNAGSYGGAPVAGSGGMPVAGSGGGGGVSSGVDAGMVDASFFDASAADASLSDRALADAPFEAIAPGDSTVPRDIAFLYKCTDVNPSDSQIGPSYRLVDMGISTVNLSDFKVRYYVTNETKVALLSDYLYAEVSGGSGYRDIRSNATVTFATLTPPRPGADAYVDVTLNAAAGTLTSGQTCTVNFVVHTPGYATNLNESDDYSHDISKTDFGPSDKITVYYKDKLALGVEP